MEPEVSKYWITDPDDPEAPVVIEEYNGLHPGMHVVYQNPAWRQPDGSYKTGGMDPPLVITELVRMPGLEERRVQDRVAAEHRPVAVQPVVQAVLNDGEWEVNADNLAPEHPEGYLDALDDDPRSGNVDLVEDDDA
jgi:hypothetical protein